MDRADEPLDGDADCAECGAPLGEWEKHLGLCDLCAEALGDYQEDEAA